MRLLTIFAALALCACQPSRYDPLEGEKACMLIKTNDGYKWCQAVVWRDGQWVQLKSTQGSAP